MGSLAENSHVIFAVMGPLIGAHHLNDSTYSWLISGLLQVDLRRLRRITLSWRNWQDLTDTHFIDDNV